MARRVFKWSCVLLAGIAVLCIAGAILFPESAVRTLAGRKGSGALGRSFSIEGPLSIQWRWSAPRVHAEDVRIANAPGFPDGNMLEIGAVDFSIAIWRLLYGRLDLPDLEISGARLVLEKDANGAKNWDFPALSAGRAVGAAVVPAKRQDFPAIGRMALKNSTLVYRDGTSHLDLRLALESASGSSGGRSDGVRVSGEGTLQGQAFTLKAEGGPVSALRGSSKPYPLRLDLVMGKTSVSLSGTFQDPVRLSGVDATLDVKGDNLADLFYLTAIPLPPTPPYSVSGALGRQGAAWSFRNFRGKVGDSDLAGDLAYDTSGPRGKVDAAIVSGYLDMDDLSGLIGAAPSVGKGESAGAEQKAEAAKQAASPRLLPDVPIDLDRLRAADIDVRFDAKRLSAPGYPLDSLSARLILDDGLLTVDPLRLGVASGAIEGSLVLDGRAATPDVKTDMVAKRLALKDFFRDSRFEDLSAGHFGGHIALAGRGRSLAEVLGGSDGHITLTMAGGKISLLIVEAAGLDIAEASPLLLGEDKTTDIRCGIGDFAVKGGLLKSDILVFDTVDTNMQGQAAIDLKNETIDAKMEAHPKDQSPLSVRTPIVVSGRLKSPDIGIDPAEAGARAGAATVLGALLTPLAAIMPFIELGLGKDSDCAGLIAEARANMRQDGPAPAHKD